MCIWPVALCIPQSSQAWWKELHFQSPSPIIHLPNKQRWLTLTLVPLTTMAGLELQGSWHTLCCCSPATFLMRGPRICIHVNGLMWGAHQPDFPRGSGSQLGHQGLPLVVQPGARWRVMACGGSRADVPHCARAQKQAGLDGLFFPPPLLLLFSFTAVTLTANSCSSVYVFISLHGVKLLGMFSMRMLLPCPTRVSYGLCYFPLFIPHLNVHVGGAVPCASHPPEISAWMIWWYKQVIRVSEWVSRGSIMCHKVLLG